MSNRNNPNPLNTTPIIGTPQNFLNNHEPKNTGEYTAGLVIVGVCFAFCFWLWLHYKAKSPSAKAEMDLKLNLVNEFNDFKESINTKHSELDKRLSLNERDYIEIKAQVNKMESKLNTMFGSLHDTIITGNEGIMSILVKGQKPKG